MSKEKPNLEQMLKLWSKKDLWNRIQEKNKQIADLEAKLEAREEAIKYLKGIKRYDIGEMLTENTKLKQQLAEKEKKIEKWKTKWYESETNFLKLYEQSQNNNQDKISFAVEKLKETQIYVDNQHFMNARYKCEKKVYADIWNFIDNQIKQLKEGK